MTFIKKEIWGKNMLTHIFMPVFKRAFSFFTLYIRITKELDNDKPSGENSSTVKDY